MPATIASVHEEALALQSVLSTVTTEIQRSHGNLAAGKLNRVGTGLASLVSGLDELDVELLAASSRTTPTQTPRRRP